VRNTCGRALKSALLSLIFVFLIVFSIATARGQIAGTAEGMSATAQRTPLSELIQQLELQNPSVVAGQKAYEASRYQAKQASALPGTDLTVQHLSVGSPRPFAGYTNSDFAYLGFGVSQELPFPGKRKLRGEAAERGSDATRISADVIRQDAIQKLKLDYIQLAYLQQTLALLEENNRSLGDIEQIVESRYRVGQGNQQEILKAQLQHTRILNEITMHHREVGMLQADIKALLNRTQESDDIITEPLTTTAIEKLPQLNQSIELESRRVEMAQTEAATHLAKLETKPDFNVQYMWQHTDDKFRDYYVATFGLRLPNRGQAKAAIAEANLKQQQVQAEYEAAQRELESETQKELVLIRTSDEQLKIYDEGLIPQSTATLRAATATYESGKQGFETLMAAFIDVLQLKIEFQRELSERESAVARLERLTGVTLR
jgi:cobalt-zinc-cadmium efflux system outer membrane protein